MDDTFTRMIFATAALAALVAVLAGPAGASQSGAPRAQSAVAVVPYLSHGVGVDATRFSEQASLARAPQTIPYLSQGVGVDAAQFVGHASRPLTSAHAALLVGHPPASGPEPLGLSGDSPLTRVSAPPTSVPGAAPAPAVSGGEDLDWTSFVAGAGMTALVAAGLVGILLTVRRRHPIGMP